MNFGSTDNGGATFVLTPREFEDFRRGQTVIRKSADARGEFTIRLKLDYEYPEHPVLDWCEKLIAERGQFEFTPKWGGKYTVKEADTRAGFNVCLEDEYLDLNPLRINDALHLIEKHAADKRLKLQQAESKDETLARCTFEMNRYQATTYLGHDIDRTSDEERGSGFKIDGKGYYPSLMGVVNAIRKGTV